MAIFKRSSFANSQYALRRSLNDIVKTISEIDVSSTHEAEQASTTIEHQENALRELLDSAVKLKAQARSDNDSKKKADKKLASADKTLAQFEQAIEQVQKVKEVVQSVQTAPARIDANFAGGLVDSSAAARAAQDAKLANAPGLRKMAKETSQQARKQNMGLLRQKHQVLRDQSKQFSKQAQHLQQRSRKLNERITKAAKLPHTFARKAKLLQLAQEQNALALDIGQYEQSVAQSKDDLQTLQGSIQTLGFSNSKTLATAGIKKSLEKVTSKSTLLQGLRNGNHQALRQAIEATPK